MANPFIFKKGGFAMSMYRSPFEDLFDTINKVFATVDVEFRDAERRFGLRNALPSVSVPSIKTYSYYEDIRSYDDGEKVETYKNGKLHGVVKYHDKKKPDEYWIDGREVSKEKWDAHIQKIEDERVHEVYVDGVPYTLTGKQLKGLKEQLKDIKKQDQKT
jgi:hypothetical protein